MKQFQKSLLLAAAMLLVALLSVFDVIPAAFAEFAPLALLVFLPWVLGEGSGRCSLRRSKEA